MRLDFTASFAWISTRCHWARVNRVFMVSSLGLDYRQALATPRRRLRRLRWCDLGTNRRDGESGVRRNQFYSQHFYHNQLLDITTSELPHIAEAAKGFGEGARRNLPAAELRNMLDAATVVIAETI